MDLNPIEMVLKNPYTVSEIMERLDIRSLSSCHSVCKDLYSAATYECERRKEVIHLYLLNNNQINGEVEDVPDLLQTFRCYTNIWLKMRPKYVILFVGGYRQNQIDYRKRVLKELCQHLPNNCTIIYLDVGHVILTSSIRHKSLTNYSGDSNNNSGLQRTSFPCMSCIFVPDFKGIQIKTYNRFEDIDTNGVKCVLLFLSSKKLSRKTKIEKREEIEATTKELSVLMSNFRYDVSFGGGTVEVAESLLKESTDEPLLKEHLFVTFGGNSIRTASAVISTTSVNLCRQKLQEFKNQLDFNCENITDNITIGYIFANKNIFTKRFSSLLQKVFPRVGIFGFQTNNRMYGKNSTEADKYGLNSVHNPNINPANNCVIVLMNIESKKDFSDY